MQISTNQSFSCNSEAFASELQENRQSSCFLDTTWAVMSSAVQNNDQTLVTRRERVNGVVFWKRLNTKHSYNTLYTYIYRTLQVYIMIKYTHPPYNVCIRRNHVYIHKSHTYNHILIKYTHILYTICIRTYQVYTYTVYYMYTY